MNEFTINFGSPFGSLTIISSYEKLWAQQGSNLRPLACSEDVPSLDMAGRGPVWCLPAMTVAGRSLTWPGVGGRWLPFGSPISLAPLTFKNAATDLKLGTAPAMGGPLALDGNEPVCPGHVGFWMDAPSRWEDTPARHQSVASWCPGGPGTVAA